MDPLTHTLVGANLASTRLGTKSRLATAALVVGANLPDVDVLAYAISSDFAIGFRRGWTHGILALAVLPFLLTGVLLLVDRRERPRSGWLLLLSAIAIATHPFLDWLNNYGMRWLMPFDGRWFYGDAVFIMDPWLWLVLGGAWLAGKAPSRGVVIGWGVFAVTIAFAVARRAPGFLPVVALIALLLLAALRWRGGEARATRLSTLALLVTSLYIGARLAIHAATVAEVRRQAGEPAQLIVAPHPLTPLLWDVVAREGNRYRAGRFSWFDRRVGFEPREFAAADASPLWGQASSDPSIRGFLTWTRAPWIESEVSGGATRVFLMDARYARERTTGFGGASVVTRDKSP